eukprot:12324675-Alexandrium_andersonii.AAC.1
MAAHDMGGGVCALFEGRSALAQSPAPPGACRGGSRGALGAGRPRSRRQFACARTTRPRALWRALERP